MKWVIGILFILPLIIWIGMRCWYKPDVEFTNACSGHLKRAADANTVELATSEMIIAVKYLQNNHLTHGYTSVIYRTPDEDVGFWYHNLNSSLEELRKVDAKATQLERTNVLMKLRETLIDHGKDGDTITMPDGVSVFPHNKGYALAGVLFSVLALIGALLVLPWLLGWDAPLRYYR